HLSPTTPPLPPPPPFLPPPRQRHALGMPPQILERVIRPRLGIEQMNNDRSVVQKNPPALVVSFDAHPVVAHIAFKDPVALLADGVQLAAAVTGGQHEI